MVQPFAPAVGPEARKPARPSRTTSRPRGRALADKGLHYAQGWYTMHVMAEGIEPRPSLDGARTSPVRTIKASLESMRPRRHRRRSRHRQGQVLRGLPPWFDRLRDLPGQGRQARRVGRQPGAVTTPGRRPPVRRQPSQRGPRQQPDLLTVNNIEVIYDDVILVLRGLSLAVPQGKVVALLGSNGAGQVHHPQGPLRVSCPPSMVPSPTARLCSMGRTSPSSTRQRGSSSG
jgi:hypothetical protein